MANKSPIIESNRRSIKKAQLLSKQEKPGEGISAACGRADKEKLHGWGRSDKNPLAEGAIQAQPEGEGNTARAKAAQGGISKKSPPFATGTKSREKAPCNDATARLADSLAG